MYFAEIGFLCFSPLNWYKQDQDLLMLQKNTTLIHFYADELLND